MSRIAVAAPQWRIADCRAAAAAMAIRSGADELQIDFGGAHRGPRLDVPAEQAVVARIARSIPVTALAVNHANDLGLIDEHGEPNAEAAALLRVALRCAVELGIGVLHVPGFRRSAPDSPQRVAGTAAVLRSICQRAERHGITVAYESALSGAASAALVEAVGHRDLRVVFDIGNLLDFGHRPGEFVSTVGELLHPDLHVKDPVASRVDVVSELRDVLSSPAPVRSLLVENDYRAIPGRLAADVAVCRGLIRSHATRMHSRC